MSKILDVKKEDLQEKNRVSIASVQAGDQLQEGPQLQENGLIEQDQALQIEQEEKKIPVVQAEKLSLKEGSKEAILKYERDTKDYAKYGVGFDLKSVTVTDADHSEMREVKEALKEYLQMREYLINDKGISFKTAEEEAERLDKGTQGLIFNPHGVIKYDDISASDKEQFGAAYDRVKRKVKDYLMANDRFFMSKRGRARLAQVKRIDEMLHVDNMTHFLSSDRQNMLNGFDVKYSHANGMVSVPTWLLGLKSLDRVDFNNIVYRNRRRKQRENDQLPGMGQRMGEWFDVAMKNTGTRIKAGIFFAFGAVDRLLGLGTMIAGNALTLGGKILKAPLKLLSLGINGIGKLCGRKRNIWNVKFHPTKGWKDLDEGRQLFRDCAKGLFSVPTALYESVVRGFPYLFNKMRGKETEEVYQKTASLSLGMRSRVEKIFRGLGYDDKLYERMSEEMDELKMDELDMLEEKEFLANMGKE